MVAGDYGLSGDDCGGRGVGKGRGRDIRQTAGFLFYKVRGFCL